MWIYFFFLFYFSSFLDHLHYLCCYGHHWFHRLLFLFRFILFVLEEIYAFFFMIRWYRFSQLMNIYLYLAINSVQKLYKKKCFLEIFLGEMAECKLLNQKLTVKIGRIYLILNFGLLLLSLSLIFFSFFLYNNNNCQHSEKNSDYKLNDF